MTRRETRIGYAIVLVTWAGLGAIGLGVVGAFAHVFREVGVMLPAPTRCLVGLADRPVLAAALLLAVLVPLTIAELTERPSPRARWRAQAALALLAPMLLVWAAWVLFLPIFVPCYTKL